LAALFESPVALVQQSDLAKEDLGLFTARQRLTVILLEGRFVVERVDLTQSAREKNLDRPLGLGRVVGRRVGRFATDGGRLQKALSAEQLGQGDATEPRAELGQKIAAVRLER
jgi:hypothetical protein